MSFNHSTISIIPSLKKRSYVQPRYTLSRLYISNKKRHVDIVMAPFGGTVTTKNFVRQCGEGCFWKGVDAGGVRVEGRGGKWNLLGLRGKGGW